MQPAPDRRNPIRLKRLRVESTEKKKRSTPELINRFTEVILDMREKEVLTEGAYLRIMNIAKDVYDLRQTGLALTLKRLQRNIGNDNASAVWIRMAEPSTEEIMDPPEDTNHAVLLHDENDLARMCKISAKVATDNAIPGDLFGSLNEQVHASGGNESLPYKDVTMQVFLVSLQMMHDIGTISHDALQRALIASNYLRRIPVAGILMTWRTLADYVGEFVATDAWYLLVFGTRAKKTLLAPRDVDYSNFGYLFTNEVEVAVMCSYVTRAALKQQLFATIPNPIPSPAEVAEAEAVPPPPARRRSARLAAQQP